MTFRRGKESCDCKHSWKGWKIMESSVQERGMAGGEGERFVQGGEMGVLFGNPPWGPGRVSRCGAELLHPQQLQPSAVPGADPHSHPHLLQMHLEQPGLWKVSLWWDEMVLRCLPSQTIPGFCEKRQTLPCFPLGSFSLCKAPGFHILW